MSPELQRSSAMDEEVARAEMYGLLATLFYQPPDQALLAQLQAAVTEAPEAGGFLEEPWCALVAQSRSMMAAQIAAEYNALFGGVGKPEVYLFGSHYLSGFLNEKPLVQLRHDLAALGLARDEQMPETEDHVAYLMEVMRYLIAGEDVAVCNLTHQSRFFGIHIQPWLSRMCQEMAAHPRAAFYARLAELTEAFASVESQGFDLMS
ncbi:MAG: molecular chaperone [Limnohabitans sp.]